MVQNIGYHIIEKINLILFYFFHSKVALVPLTPYSLSVDEKKKKFGMII
jgi:hypothetical protein